MSNHIIPETFNSSPKKPWYRKPLTWVIAGAVVLVFSVGAATGGADRSASQAGSFTPGKTAQGPLEKPEPEKPEPVEVVIEEPDIEQLGLEVLRDLYPYYQAADDASIIEAATASCEMFDAGGSFDMFLTLALENGIGAEETGALFGFATSVYCPEHAGLAG